MRALLLVLVGCVVAGCGPTDESRLQIGVHGNEAVLRPLLTVTATSGDWSLVVRGEEIGTAGSSNWTREYETPDRGTLAIDVVLARPGEPPLAAASVSLEIRRDWVWGVDIILTDTNPTLRCFGCIGHEAVPVPGDLVAETTTDSLFVVWGGNSIRDPVVY